MISAIFLKSSFFNKTVSLFSDFRKVSIKEIDFPTNSGVYNANICATIVITIPNKKRNLYFIKYIFKYCNSFI